MAFFVVSNFFHSDRASAELCEGGFRVGFFRDIRDYGLERRGRVNMYATFDKYVALVLSVINQCGMSCCVCVCTFKSLSHFSAYFFIVNDKFYLSAYFCVSY